MGSEVAVALSWLYSTLAQDTTLSGYAPGGVWRAEAPDGTTPPYTIITYQPQQSRDEVVFGGGRAYSDLFFEVCTAGPANVTQTIANAATRIDTLLTVAQQTAITGGTLLASFRSAPVEGDPLINGEVWTNMGGVYRIMIKAS